MARNARRGRRDKVPDKYRHALTAMAAALMRCSRAAHAVPASDAAALGGGVIEIAEPQPDDAAIGYTGRGVRPRFGALRLLAVGDSYFLPRTTPDYIDARTTLIGYASTLKRTLPDFNYKIRTTKDGVRVWRIAKNG